MKRLIFNNLTLPDWLVITKAPFEWAAPAGWQTRKVANRRGVIPERLEKGPRVLPYDVEIMAYDENDLDKKLEQLAFLLHSDEPCELIYTGTPDRHYMALHDDIRGFNKIIDGLAEGTITFLVPSGEKLGGGHDVTFSQNHTENVTCTDSVYPIFSVVFTADQSNYKIEHDSGKYMNIVFEFVTGQTLELDHKKGAVKIDGVLNQAALSLKSKFFVLNPGQNGLTVTTGQASSQTNLTYTDVFR